VSSSALVQASALPPTRTARTAAAANLVVEPERVSCCGADSVHLFDALKEAPAVAEVDQRRRWSKTTVVIRSKKDFRRVGDPWNQDMCVMMYDEE